MVFTQTTNKYSSMTFNSLAFITIHVGLSSEQNISESKNLNKGIFLKFGCFNTE